LKICHPPHSGGRGTVVLPCPVVFIKIGQPVSPAKGKWPPDGRFNASGCPLFPVKSEAF
jgi:hypothetical protein